MPMGVPGPFALMRGYAMRSPSGDGTTAHQARQDPEADASGDHRRGADQQERGLGGAGLGELVLALALLHRLVAGGVRGGVVGALRTIEVDGAGAGLTGGGTGVAAAGGGAGGGVARGAGRAAPGRAGGAVAAVAVATGLLATGLVATVPVATRLLTAVAVATGLLAAGLVAAVAVATGLLATGLVATVPVATRLLATVAVATGLLAALVGATFVGAALVGTAFVRATFIGAALVGTAFVRATLVGAALVGTTLVGAALVDTTGAPTVAAVGLAGEPGLGADRRVVGLHADTKVAAHGLCRTGSGERGTCGDHRTGGDPRDAYSRLLGHLLLPPVAVLVSGAAICGPRLRRVRSERRHIES
ncbi:pentapeptide repeat-containing protein [Streptomyces sp. NPDC014622]|uniref:pentapeptide repeat-containing protein n=1 Tax=Streptomyces sp. NPDC014622 TaxID=3364874 RepID=UPI0036FB5F9B